MGAGGRKQKVKYIPQKASFMWLPVVEQKKQNEWKAMAFPCAGGGSMETSLLAAGGDQLSDKLHAAVTAPTDWQGAEPCFITFADFLLKHVPQDWLWKAPLCLTST